MADAADGFNESNYELAECAKINFENFERMNPAVKLHPMYQIAKMQFEALVKRLDVVEMLAD